MTSFSPYLPRQYTPCIFTNAIRARLVLLFAVSILNPPSNCAIMYCGKQLYKNIFINCQLCLYLIHVYPGPLGIVCGPWGSGFRGGGIGGSGWSCVGS